MNRRSVLLGGAATLACMSLSACHSPDEPLRVALNDWIGYSPLVLAQELGHVDEATVRLVEQPSNTASIMALANRELSVAALTLDEFLLAREGGLDVRAVMVFNESHGADVVMAHPAIAELRALKGKRIGVESSAVGALMLARLLERAQLEPSELDQVTLTADQHVKAYAAGQVDAVITFEPMASQLRAQGAKVLLDSSHFPGLIVDVLVAHAELPARQHGHLRRLLAGHFAAVSHLRRDPVDAARRLAPHQQLTPDEVRQAFSGIHLLDLNDNRQWLSGPQPRLIDSVRSVATIMQSSRLLGRLPALDGLCDASFLPEGNA